MKSKSYLFILRSTVLADFDILIENVSDSKYLIPQITVSDDDIQGKTMECATKLLGQGNVELLSCIGSNDDSRAYLLRVIGSQSIITKLDDSHSLKFIPLKRDLEKSLQSDAKHYFASLLDYVSDNLFWD